MTRPQAEWLSQQSSNPQSIRPIWCCRHRQLCPEEHFSGMPIPIFWLRTTGPAGQVHRPEWTPKGYSPLKRVTWERPNWVIDEFPGIFFRRWISLCCGACVIVQSWGYLCCFVSFEQVLPIVFFKNTPPNIWFHFKKHSIGYGKREEILCKFVAYGNISQPDNSSWCFGFSCSGKLFVCMIATGMSCIPIALWMTLSMETLSSLDWQVINNHKDI